MSNTYIFGHKSPDTDSITSSLVMADLESKLGNEVTACRLGSLNKETEYVLDYFGIDKEDAIAFGDGNNDIEMFEVVGNKIAMGNASDELKEIATDICKTAADDGIYHYCLEKGLI